MRWALSIAFAALGLLFTFSGFVTAMFATGRQADHIGVLWQNQARFRLACGATLWLASALVLITLRRRGLVAVLRGRDIAPTKRWLYLILIGFLTLLSMYSWLDLLTHR